MSRMAGRSTRWPAVLGVTGGSLISLSSGAHSLLGWPQVRQQLTAAGVGHGFNPFFFVFIVPALLLLVASLG
jgi:hypothetical protein